MQHCKLKHTYKRAMEAFPFMSGFRRIVGKQLNTSLAFEHLKAYPVGFK